MKIIHSSALLLCASVSLAYGQSVSPTYTFASGLVGQQVVEANLQGFNTALGTLNSISVRYVANMTVKADLEQRSTLESRPEPRFAGSWYQNAAIGFVLPSVDATALDSSLSFVGQAPIPAGWSSSSNFASSDTSQNTGNLLPIPANTTIPFDGTIDFAGTSGDSYPTTNTISLDQTTVFTSPSDIAYFTDPGNISLFGISNAGAGVIASGNVISSITTTSSHSFELVYNYTPIPEPSSTALIGLGAISLLVRRKR